MIKFRGITEEGKEVFGHYLTANRRKRPIHVIMPEKLAVTQFNWLYRIVIPESIGAFTTRLDKNKKEIYGSIPIDGKMSQGGDIVYDGEIPAGAKGEVIWDILTARWKLNDENFYDYMGDKFSWDELEVIGTQWKEKK